MYKRAADKLEPKLVLKQGIQKWGFFVFFLVLGGGVYVAAPIVNCCDEPMVERGRKKNKEGQYSI